MPFDIIDNMVFLMYSCIKKCIMKQDNARFAKSEYTDRQTTKNNTKGWY